MPTLNSSSIFDVEYDPESRALTVTFRSGRSYTLHDVPEHEYHGLLNSSSPGWYFNAYLKGRY